MFSHFLTTCLGHEDCKIYQIFSNQEHVTLEQQYITFNPHITPHTFDCRVIFRDQYRVDPMLLVEELYEKKFPQHIKG